MAITAGRASCNHTQTVANGVWTQIFPDNFNGCEEFFIWCNEDSSAGVRVCVLQRAGNGDSVHRATLPGDAETPVPDDWIELLPGERLPFSGSVDNKIVQVQVAGDGGTANIRWTITKA